MDALFGALIIALGGLVYWLLYTRTGDALHPLGLFTGIWLAVFGFAHFDVPRTYDEPYYAEPFVLVTYLVVFGALLAFAFGFWLADPGAEPLDRERVAWRLDRGVSWSRLRWITPALFLVASATTVYFVQQAGAVPLFSPRIDELRTEFKLPLWGYVYDLHYPAALFGTMLAFRARGAWGRTGWILLVLASLSQLMISGVRVSPMTAMAWVLIFLFYRRYQVRLRHGVVAAVLAVAVFAVIESYRRTPYELNPDVVNPRLDLSPEATAWAHTAASFKNLQYTLQTGVSPLNMGLTSYDLPKTLNPEARSVSADISYMYGTHNTPTFLSFLYFDFGVGGLLVMPLVYGAGVAFVYRVFRTRTNLFWLLVYIDFLLAVVLTFRTHRFLGNNLIWFAGVGLVSQLLAGRQLPEEGEEAGGSEPGEGPLDDGRGRLPAAGALPAGEAA